MDMGKFRLERRLKRSFKGNQHVKVDKIGKVEKKNVSKRRPRQSKHLKSVEAAARSSQEFSNLTLQQIMRMMSLCQCLQRPQLKVTLPLLEDCFKLGPGQTSQQKWMLMFSKKILMATGS